MSAECWHCHVPLEPRRPYRAEFDSEPAWLIACGIYLDFTFPQRAQYRERIREWERLEAEGDPARVIARIRELVVVDELAPDEEVELDRLIDLYRTHRTNARKA